MMKPVWIVAFSGHRPGTGPGRDLTSLEACREPLRQVFKKLRDQAGARGGAIEFLGGVAAGADLVAVEVARELEIPVHVILPLPESLIERDYRGELSEQFPRAKNMIDYARRGEGGNTLRIASGDHTPPDCYHEANVQMLQACDLLVVVFNGESSDSLGGTAEVITQAQCFELPVVSIDPGQGGSVYWPDDATHWPANDPLYEELMQTCVTTTDESQEHSAESVFHALDEEAKQSGSRFRGRLMVSVYLHFLAAILAATTSAFSPVLHHFENTYGMLAKLIPQAMTGLEFGLVSVALGLMMLVRARHYHQVWCHTRFAAEIIRGLRATAGLLDPLNPLVLHHAPGWRRFAVTIALDAHRRRDTSISTPNRLKSYLNGRVADQADRYFKKQYPRSKVWAARLGKIGTLSAITAPVIIGVAFAIKLVNPNLSEHDHLAALFASWLPVVLPLLAGSATALLVASDHARRSERYTVMAEQLERTRCTLPSLKTVGAISRVVAITEEILLAELIEWSAAAKTTGH